MAQLERTVPPEAEGLRIDVFLAESAEITRARAAQLIAQGCVWIDQRPAVKAGLKLCAGAVLAWTLPEARPMQAEPEALPLHILYQDADLAVVEKPTGMVVHPAAGNAQGTLVHALLYHLRDLSGIGGVLRPGIVHRLDKDTSGALIVAKHDAAHLALSAQLKARAMRKVYAALVEGAPREDEGCIDLPLARDPRDRKRMAVVPGGREARTLYRVAARWPGMSLLCIRLITGRTHQIRVHMRATGHPLLGDVIYGGRRTREQTPRLMLHANQVTFAHPTTGTAMTVCAPWPSDFVAALARAVPTTPGQRPEDAAREALARWEAVRDTWLQEENPLFPNP